MGLTVNACDLITILLKNVHLGLHSDNWDSENIVKNTACKKAYEETCDKDMMLSVIAYDGSNRICSVMENVLYCMYMSQLALRRWPNVGIGRHRRDRQPTSRQRWYSVACVATVCWHSVGARRLAYRSLPMFCVWTSVVRIKCFSNKCCRSTKLSIHQLHI